VIGYDGFKRITGTKLHVAVDNNGLPVSVVISPANIHDSTKFVDVMESISDLVDDELIKQIVSVYADKGYDSTSIRNYLKNNDIKDCIPFRNYNTKNNQTENNFTANNYSDDQKFVNIFAGFLKT